LCTLVAHSAAGDSCSLARDLATFLAERLAEQR
jgi:hypothetical protein